MISITLSKFTMVYYGLLWLFHAFPASWKLLPAHHGGHPPGSPCAGGAAPQVPGQLDDCPLGGAAAAAGLCQRCSDDVAVGRHLDVQNAGRLKHLKTQQFKMGIWVENMSFDDFPANPPENRGIFCIWAGWIKVAMFWAIAIKFLSGDLGTKRMGI